MATSRSARENGPSLPWGNVLGGQVSGWVPWTPIGRDHARNCLPCVPAAQRHRRRQRSTAASARHWHYPRRASQDRGVGSKCSGRNTRGRCAGRRCCLRHPAAAAQRVALLMSGVVARSDQQSIDRCLHAEVYVPTSAWRVRVGSTPAGAQSRCRGERRTGACRPRRRGRGRCPSSTGPCHREFR